MTSPDLADAEPLDLRLPSQPQLREGVQISREGERVLFSFSGRAVSVESSTRQLDALVAYLASPIRAEPLSERKDLSVFAAAIGCLGCQGLLFDAASPRGAAGCSGFNILGPLIDHIETLMADRVGQHPVLHSLLNGSAPRSLMLGWLLENYFYTSAASWHIPPVLEHRMSGSERREWQELLDEERTHWRIYKPAFQELGWSIDEAARGRPIQATQQFLDCLHRLSTAGPLLFSAALLAVEQPPDAEDFHEDPLYGSLCRNYGFSERAIRPLWWHATENERSGHASLGARVISHASFLDADLYAAVFDAGRATVEALQRWYDGIGETYSQLPVTAERFPLG